MATILGPFGALAVNDRMGARTHAPGGRTGSPGKAGGNQGSVFAILHLANVTLSDQLRFWVALVAVSACVAAAGAWGSQMVAAMC